MTNESLNAPDARSRDEGRLTARAHRARDIPGLRRDEP